MFWFSRHRATAISRPASCWTTAYSPSPRCFRNTIMEPVPPHDLLFNTIGDADLCVDALNAAVSIAASAKAPVINRPDAVLQTGRMHNARRFARLPGVIAPKIETHARQELLGANAAKSLVAAGFEFPLLLRPPGFQTGQHFMQVETPATLYRDCVGDPHRRRSCHSISRFREPGRQDSQIPRDDDRRRSVSPARGNLS